MSSNKSDNEKTPEETTTTATKIAKTKTSDDNNDNDDKNDKESSTSTSGRGLPNVQSLGKLLAEKLNFRTDDRDDDDDDDEGKVKVLDSVSIDGIVQYIKEKKCKNIITMAGAGISTSAGIPDFRSPNSGLYDNLEKYNLPHPQAIFELDFFHKNPVPFFLLAKELYPGKFKPTIAHYFIRLLLEKKLLLRHYTQNIDTLERIAGIPDEKLVEAHGTFYTGHCLRCHKEYPLKWMKEKIFNDEIPPVCNKCKIGIVKPDIVFFGESLPKRFHYLLQKDFDKCDLLIILGSSLVVQPFASLVDMVPETCPRLLINREKAGQRSTLMSMLGISSGGLDFDGKNNTRDVAWLGDCDDGCQLLADKLGWGDELKELREKELKTIEEEKEAETSSKNVNKCAN